MDKKLNSSGDIVIENNDVVMVDGLDAIKQDLATRLGFFQGEWIFDTSKGFPWFRDVLIKNPYYKVVGELLKTYILETKGITEFIEFYFDIASGESKLRQAVLKFKVLTVSGFLDYSDSVGF